MKYSIVYSSPFYYLYNEFTNELIMQNVDGSLVSKVKEWLDKISNKKRS